MNLKPINNTSLELVASWMAEKENYKWLDFGEGNHPLNPVALKVMAQKDSHVLRTFTDDERDMPIGLVALSNVNRGFKTAMLWYVLGNKEYSGKGYTTRAVSQILGLGFGELGLHAVNAWAVEENAASIRVLKRNNFQLIGRLRQCHYIDGRPCDRLLFDLLASEYKEL